MAKRNISKIVPALIPILPPTPNDCDEQLHQQKQLNHEEANEKRRPLPYIILPTSASKPTINIGRAILILTTASACKCLFPSKSITVDSTPSSSISSKARFSYRPSCRHCKKLESWACKRISKQMIQITRCNNNEDSNNSHCDDGKNEKQEEEWKIKCIGKNSRHIIRILSPEQKRNQHYLSYTKEDWKHKNEFRIRQGYIIRFIHQNSHKKNSHNCNKHTIQQDEGQWSKMEFKVAQITIYSDKTDDTKEQEEMVLRRELANRKEEQSSYKSQHGISTSTTIENSSTCVTSPNPTAPTITKNATKISTTNYHKRMNTENNDKKEKMDDSDNDKNKCNSKINIKDQIQPKSLSSQKNFTTAAKSSHLPKNEVDKQLKRRFSSTTNQIQTNKKDTILHLYQQHSPIELDLMTPSPKKKTKMDSHHGVISCDHPNITKPCSNEDQQYSSLSPSLLKLELHQHTKNNEDAKNSNIINKVQQDFSYHIEIMKKEKPKQGDDGDGEMNQISETFKHDSNITKNLNIKDSNTLNKNQQQNQVFVIVDEEKIKDKNEKIIEVIDLSWSPESPESPKWSDDKSTITQLAINDTKAITSANVTTAHTSTNTDDITTTIAINKDIQNDSNKVSIFFLHRGRTMSKARIDILKTSLFKKAKEGKKKNVQFELDIMTNFDKKKMPNYFIVDSNLSLENFCTGLGFRDIQEMAMTFRKHDQTSVVKPDWVIEMNNIQDKPSINQIWAGMFELKLKIKSLEVDFVAEKNERVKSVDCWIERSRKVDLSAPASRLKALERRNEPIDCLSKYQHPKIKHPIKIGKNLELCELFNKISKLYKEMPLDKFDEWRSYSYNAASARLKYLDFPVFNDEDCLKELGNRKGFGKKFMRQIREFLNTGKCQLIAEFEHDPMRVNVRNMIKIWGIGAKKAIELVKLGYTDISSVRRAIEQNKLDLYENARIGVQFYEEFQEKMERNEVRIIGDIVAQAFRKYFQHAEIATMGSYRRGIQRCGDVDVLITHPKFVEYVPKGSVDELVERLHDQGYISHHLTSVDLSHKATFPLRTDHLNHLLMNTSKKALSYMGVFVSPLYPDKHRRIDIKFYPYQERAFATLYFTGNGWFNRAIRWYAKTKKKMKLDDTGLYKLASQEQRSYKIEGKRLNACTEKEIFDLLDLFYKEPHERDSFEAIVPKTGSQLMFNINMSHSDIEAESRHSWIN